MRLSTTNVALVIPLAAIAMRFASPDTANFSYLVLAGYALLGRAQAIQALALSWLFTMVNPGLAPEATAASVLRYAVIAGAAVSLLLRNGLGKAGFSVSWPVLATTFLGAFLVIHSMFFSPMRDVSILKAVSWTITMVTLLAAWGGLSKDARARLESQIFGGLMVVLVVSLPLLVTGVGYLRNGTGFQGILSQPQAFGPTMALLGAWLFGRLIGESRTPWIHWALLGAVIVLIVLSEARTAGLALLVGVPVAVMFSAAASGSSMRRLMPGLVNSRLHLIVLLASAALLIAGPQLADQFSKYVQKRSDAVTVLQAYDIARGPVIREMWSNFLRSPMQGIGFGLAADTSTMEVQRMPFLDLPTGASVEKGVMPLAVLEELGLPGFLAVAAWLVMLLRRSARGGLIATAVFCTAVLTNMGEAMLFSPGGMGLLVLVLMCWAATKRVQLSRKYSGHD